jgi:hypothetical protein
MECIRRYCRRRGLEDIDLELALTQLMAAKAAVPRLVWHRESAANR